MGVSDNVPGTAPEGFLDAIYDKPMSTRALAEAVTRNALVKNDGVHRINVRKQVFDLAFDNDVDVTSMTPAYLQGNGRVVSSPHVRFKLDDGSSSMTLAIAYPRRVPSVHAARLVRSVSNMLQVLPTRGSNFYVSFSYLRDSKEPAIVVAPNRFAIDRTLFDAVGNIDEQCARLHRLVRIWAVRGVDPFIAPVDPAAPAMKGVRQLPEVR